MKHTRRDLREVTLRLGEAIIRIRQLRDEMDTLIERVEYLERDTKTWGMYIPTSTLSRSNTIDKVASKQGW